MHIRNFWPSKKVVIGAFMFRLKEQVKKIAIESLRSNKQFAFALMVLSFGLGHRVHFRWLSDRALWEVEDLSGKFLVARKGRLHLFRHGTARRIDDLLVSYLVRREDLRDGDVVVDCGANIGEFSRAAEKRGAVVHAFEPDAVEYLCLRENIGARSTAYNFALWSHSGVVAFESTNETGDSRVIGPVPASNSVSVVQSLTLDEWSRANIGVKDRIRLLKLEAEGNEFEVLKGARQILPRIDLIAADLGEVGIDGEYPLTKVMKLLTEAGYRLADYGEGRGVALFERPERICSKSP